MKRARESEPDEPSTEDVAHFEAWLDEQGVERSVRVFSTSYGGGLSVRASSPLSAGDVAIAVPRSLLLTASDARSTELGRALVEAAERGALPGVEESAKLDELCLMLELLRRVRMEPSWAPYAAVLPRHFDLPLCYDEAVPSDAWALRWLEGTPLQWVVSGLRAGLLELHAALLEALPRDLLQRTFGSDDSEDEKEGSGEGALSWTQLEWAYAAMSSRTFKLLLPSAAVPELVVAPLACLCNHSSAPDAPLQSKRVVQRADRGGAQRQTAWLELRTARACAAGEELTLRYSDALPNWQLLLCYGFTLPDNADSTYPLALELPDDAEAELDADVRKMLLLQLSDGALSLDHALRLGHVLHARTLPPPLCASLRLLVADLAELEGARADTLHAFFDAPLSARNERAAAELLGRACEALLRALDETEPDVQAPEHAQWSAAPRVQQCAAYRREQRAILDATRTLAQQWGAGVADS